MLSTKPKITYTPASSNEYKPSVFILIDSDKGPSELTLVDSLSDFYELYSSNRRSPSYILAERLIKLNYKLYIFRVKLCESHSSIRLLDTTPVTWSYPKYGIEYNTIISANTGLKDGTYSYNIVINKKLSSTGSEYWVTSGDYIFLGDSNGWDLVWFDSLNPPIPWNLCRRLSKISSNSVDPIGELIDSLTNKFGYKVNSSKPDDNTIVLSVIAPWKIHIPITSFDNSYIDQDLNYDIECSLWNDKSIIDIYSKIDSGVSDIIVDIYKWINEYRIEVSLINSESNYIISKEIFSVDGSKESIESINSLSKLIEVKYHAGELPTGSFKLGREVKIQANINDFIGALDSIILDGIYIDIISDSAISLICTDKELLNSYYHKLNLLINELDTPSLVLSEYVSEDTVSSIDRINIAYFNDIIEYNNELYPSYLLLLDLIKNKSFEGYLNGYIKKFSYINNPILKSNELIMDSYYITEMRNPIAYIFNDKITTVQILLTYVLTMNYFVKSLDELYEYTNISITNKFLESKRFISSITSYNIDLSIYSIAITDRLLKIVFSLSADYSTNSEYELIIPIQGIE